MEEFISQGFGCEAKNSQISCVAEIDVTGWSPPGHAGPELPGQACFPPMIVYSSMAVPMAQLLYVS